MNKIVLEHYPASKLPDELRGAIARGSSVKVTIEVENGRSSGIDEFRRQWLEARKQLRHEVTVEEAVARIRALRNEWDE